MILDTNVVSEMARPRPTASVLSFVAENLTVGLSISVVTSMELSFGIKLLPADARRDVMEAALAALLDEVAGPRILPFGPEEALSCSDVMTARRSMGRSLDDHLRDAMIAATALVSGLPLVTRNTADFEGLGLVLIDPWQAS